MNLAGHDFIVTDSDGNQEVIRISDKDEKNPISGGVYISDMWKWVKGSGPDKRARAMTVVQADEALEVSYLDEERSFEQRWENHPHGDLDTNGWLSRYAHVVDADGNIYEADLRIADGVKGKTLYYIGISKKIDQRIQPSPEGDTHALINSDNIISTENNSVNRDGENNLSQRSSKPSADFSNMLDTLKSGDPDAISKFFGNVAQDIKSQTGQPVNPDSVPIKNYFTPKQTASQKAAVSNTMSDLIDQYGMKKMSSLRGRDVAVANKISDPENIRTGVKSFAESAAIPEYAADQFQSEALTNDLLHYETVTDKGAIDAADRNDPATGPRAYATQWLRDNGYDAIEVKMDQSQYGTETDAFIVLDPEQVNSADPVTYDDNGNVIPLPEGFNLGKSDIRFSRADVIDKNSVSDTIGPIINSVPRINQLLSKKYLRKNTHRLDRNDCSYIEHLGIQYSR